MDFGMGALIHVKQSSHADSRRSIDIGCAVRFATLKFRVLTMGKPVERFRENHARPAQALREHWHSRDASHPYFGQF